MSSKKFWLKPPILSSGPLSGHPHRSESGIWRLEGELESSRERGGPHFQMIFDETDEMRSSQDRLETLEGASKA